MTNKNYGEISLEAHKNLRGKIQISNKSVVKTREDLSIFYTPGVGAVSSYLAKHKNQTKNYTMKSNSVAIVSDGSAVLGLGNIGPEAALPVMEGKAMLFKEFGDVDAIPIVLATQDPDEIIATVVNIAPAFGGINLEDIAAPQCFYIEEQLQKLLDIPVMHDDQHGTAVVVLAGLINAFKVVKKDIKKSHIVILGAGAAGIAIARLLIGFGVKNIVLVDSKGIISKSRSDLNPVKKEMAKITNPDNLVDGLDKAIIGADALIGVSGPNLVTGKQIKEMNKDAIVFAMANPTPEIMPDIALKAGAMVVATGRSDFPNQVNNVLGFPGIFRGALDNNVIQITQAMELKAAKNLAGLIKKPNPELIIPDPFNKDVVEAVSQAIK